MTDRRVSRLASVSMSLESLLGRIKRFFRRSQVGAFLGGNRRMIVFSFKVVSALIGVAFLLFSLYFLAMLDRYGIGGPFSLNELFYTISMMTVAMLGISLITFLPNSIKARFKRPPPKAHESKTYGFVSMLAIGIGSTLGSPLFILIPLNVSQYAYISIISLMVASILSIAMAYAYSKMQFYSDHEKLQISGGSSFVRFGTGTRSVRYFTTRITLWFANTALAAYSVILFFDFIIFIMPSIAGGYTSTLEAVQILVVTFFAGWFVLNAFFERRYLRLIGKVQTAFVVILLVILVAFALAMLDHRGYTLNGFFSSYHGSALADIILNTGYLYILFFGFEEIMALNMDGADHSSIPLLGTMLGKNSFSKQEYMFWAMILTVVISAAVNILTAFGFYGLHASTPAITSHSIPAISIAGQFLGPYWEFLVVIAFLIASITTFIPTFLAGSRNLGALGREGFFPHSFAEYAWVFALVFMVVFALAGPNFLVEITDFMILISLGIITLSSVWLLRTKLSVLKPWQWISVVTGIGTFLFSFSIYFLDRPVVAFGILAIFLTYVFYVALDLGSVGIQVFLIIFVLSLSMVSLLFPLGLDSFLDSRMFFLGRTVLHSESVVSLMLSGLILILVNLFVDLRVIRGMNRDSRRNTSSRL